MILRQSGKFFLERYARRKLREKEHTDSKRHATTSDLTGGDLILLRQNRDKLSPTFEPEPYRVVEKNGSAGFIENSAGKSKMWNAGHMKKSVDPRAERGIAETELSVPSTATDTPEEGVVCEQDPVGGIRQNSQTQSVPLPLSPAQEGPKSRPGRKRETHKLMKDFICR